MPDPRRVLRPIVATLVAYISLAGLAQSQGHLDEVTALERRMFMLQHVGKVSEAIALAERVLKLREDALLPSHAEIATSLNNLAFLYKTQGRLQEAEPLYKRALTMREKALPAGHPEIAQSLNNLAVLYVTQGRFVEAEPLHRKALAMREKALPPAHLSFQNSRVWNDNERRIAFTAEVASKTVIFYVAFSTLERFGRLVRTTSATSLFASGLPATCSAGW